MSRLPEQLAWDKLKRHTDNVAELKLWRIENEHGDGMSDIYGINRTGTSFWLESKAIASWPIKPGTCPLKRKFEPGQIPFLKQICYFNGRAYVILRVTERDEWYLIHPKMSAIEVVDMTRRDIELHAIENNLQNIISFLSYI